MIKFILGFIVALALISLTLDCFAQGSIVVVNPDGTVKEIIILPPPPPTW